MLHLIFIFLTGLLLAFGLICPMGLLNVYILNQGANGHSYTKTVPVALTASLADTFMIIIGVSGVALVISQYPKLQMWLIIFEILFLTYIGIVMWRAKFSISQEKPTYSVKQQVFFTLGAFFLNPHAYLDTFGVIGVTAMLYHNAAKIVFTASVILVSWIWFFGLIGLGRLLRKSQFLYKIQGKLSAIIMWVSALFVSRLLF